MPANYLIAGMARSCKMMLPRVSYVKSTKINLENSVQATV